MITHCSHLLKPIINKDSQILILGSFPSVMSRKSLYYGHKSNRFWKVLETILNIELYSKSPNEKAKILLDNKIALYDVIEECDISLSSDSSIKNVTPASLQELISSANIKLILLNGKKATSLFYKFFPDITLNVISLPSTSSANAACSLDNLIKKWRDALSPYIVK